MSLRRITGLLLVGLGLAGAALADEAAERQRIAAERAAVAQRFDQAERDCASRFFVTECLDAARAERRLALDRLQRQSHLLDDARRRERAAQRLREIKAREDAASAPAPVRKPPRVLPASPASAVPRPAARLPELPDPPDLSTTGSGAAARQRDYQARQQAALDHQQAVQARNARQDAKKPPAASLPLPGASAP